MNIQSETLSETRKSFTVTIPADLYQKEEKSTLASFAHQVKIPGFRPGKAPATLIKQRHEKDIVENIRRGLVQQAIEAVAKQEKEGLESFVEVGELTEESSGGGYQVKIVADIVPSFEVPEYTGIKIELPEVQITDEDVDQEIEKLRAQQADFQEVERAAEKGDYAKISYKATLNGNPLEESVQGVGAYGNQEVTWEEVDSEDAFLPGVSAALAGLSTGESTEVEETFADNHSVEALRGLQVVYNVEVKEIRARILPEIDDAFLKKLQVETLDELKDNVRKKLQTEAENRDEEAQRAKIVEFLSENVTLQVPESLIERNTQSLLKRIVDDNVQRGVSQDILEQHRDELFEGARKNALAQAKVDLILSKIAANEKIETSQEDLSQAVFRQAYYSGENPKKIVSELRKDRSRLTALSSDIQLRKTLDWLLGKSEIVRIQQESKES